MSENSILNNKYFQEYMLVSSKDWNKLQSEQEENQTGGATGEGLDADLTRVNHSVRSALIYHVQRIRRIEEIIQALKEGRLKHHELPDGMTLEGLIARKQKLLNKYGNRIMNMGIPPATYFYTQKMHQLQQKQLDTARANTEANTATKTLQENILEQQKKNTAKLEEILAENEKGKLPLLLDHSEEEDEMDVKEGIKDSEEEKEVQGMLSRMSSSLLSMLSPKKSPTKELQVRYQPDDGEIHVQTSPSRLRGTKRLRGDHPMKTRSQATPQHGKGMVAPTVKKQHVEFYLPEDCDAYITRPLYKKPWKSTI